MDAREEFAAYEAARDASRFKSANPGTLGVLNVGAGDTKLSFDPDKPADVERACAVVVDMLKRGYAIMIQVGEKDGKPLYMRAEGFDAATAEYLIVGLPEATVQPEPKAAAPKKQRGRIVNRFRARDTHGVAVAPISGG